MIKKITTTYHSNGQLEQAKTIWYFFGIPLWCKTEIINESFKAFL